MRKYNNFDLHFRFDLKNGKINFLNAEYVHPLAIVFGSGVEFRCNSYSDLDLCIERYDVGKAFHYQAGGHDEAVDVLYADQIGERLRREIAEKGIVVYDQEGCYV